MRRNPILIDGKGHLLGRLASVVAKQLLQGEKINVVRCDQLVMSGSLFRNKLFFLAYLRKKNLSNPKRGGPTHHRAPSKIFFKAVRGMLPYKTRRGRAALARFFVYDGVPPKFHKQKKVVVPSALKALRMRPRSKYCVVGELAQHVGWKKKDVIARFEEKRQKEAKEWYKRKQKAVALEQKARNDPSVKNSEYNNILASYGYK